MPVVRRTLGLHDHRRLLLRISGNCVVVDLGFRYDSRNRYPPNRYTGPRHELRISMLTENVRVDRTCRHLGLIRQDPPEARRVQKRPAANTLLSGQTSQLLREVRQDIDRIRHQQQDGILLERLHVLDRTAQDLKIAPNQVRPALALLLFRTGRDDHDVALASLLVSAGADPGARVAVVRGVGEILDLSVADLCLGVDEEDVASNGGSR